MTNQEFFDKAVAHLRKQGKRANMPGRSQCEYTTADGLHCAVGGVMSPELRQTLIRRGLNSVSFRRLVDESPAVQAEFGGVNITLVSDMQGLHDHEEPIEWEQGFQAIAKKFGLTYKERQL